MTILSIMKSLIILWGLICLIGGMFSLVLALMDWLL